MRSPGALPLQKREAEASAAPKRKARPDSDDEGGSDSDDDFFDRTAAGGQSRTEYNTRNVYSNGSASPPQQGAARASWVGKAVGVWADPGLGP